MKDIVFLYNNTKVTLHFIPSIERLQGVSHYQGEVCKLKKIIYDLKQDPRAWFKKFTTLITSIGFYSSDYDYAFFL